MRVPILATRRQGPVLVVCTESAEIPLARRCGRELDLAFGGVPVGEYREAFVELRSEGTDPLEVRTVGLSGDSAQTFTVTTSTGTLAPAEFLRVPVRLAPGAEGPVAGVLEVTSSDGPRAVALSGQGVAAALCVRPALPNLGATAIDATLTGTVTAANCGDAPLTLSDVAVLGGPGPFSLVRPLARALTLPPVASVGYQVGIRFAPAVLGDAQARVRFTSDRGVSVITARATAAECELSVSPASLTFDIQNLERTVLVTNDGRETCLVRRVSFSDDGDGVFMFSIEPPVDVELAPGDSLSLPVNAYGSAPLPDGGRAGSINDEARGTLSLI